MENSILTISVRNKVPSVSYGEHLVADNSGYRLKFDFDDEWDIYPYKIARFQIDGWVYDKSFTGNIVRVPTLPSNIRELSVGVYAGDIQTTAPAVILVHDSIRAASTPLSTQDAAESERENSEAERAAAEVSRRHAESERQANETVRIQNENARIQAENARRSAETARQNAETTRAENESVRVSNENTRVSNENARRASESSRIQNENTRVSSENTRRSNENARVSAETARASAETARSSAETARASAEAVRENNEAARSLFESRRSEAENARAANENSRIANENLRVETENSRVQAEDARSSAEHQRNLSELDRNEAFRTCVTELMGRIRQYDHFDILALIREYGFTAAFRLFMQANAAINGIDASIERFYGAAAASVSEVYSSEFYLYTASPSPVGTKSGANASLRCVPSTNTYEGVDDYKDLPLFACFDCNYTIDALTLEPAVHAIKGIYGEFSSAPSDSFVGVIQMSGWVRRTIGEQTKKVEYAAVKKEAGFFPLPEAVRASDNSVRPYVIHAKYAAGFNSANKLSSISGVQPVSSRPSAFGGASISHDHQISRWRAHGEQYAGSSICDQSFLQTMLEIKYADLGSANIMKGCRDYNLSHAAALSESGVKRVILTPEQGAGFVVGSSVSVGTSSDRSSESCYSVCPIAHIISVSPYAYGGVDYCAVTLDADEVFDTVEGETYITTQPWATGSTDGVLGNDGSPINNQSGKEPLKLQGIELMLGVSEVIADMTLYDRGNSNDYYAYTNDLAANITSGGRGTSKKLENIAKVSGASGAKYIKECAWSANDPNSYILPSAVGGSSSTGYCAAFLQTAGNSGSGSREYVAFGNMLSQASAGLAYINGTSRLDTTGSLYGCRACGTAANRGVYTD